MVLKPDSGKNEVKKCSLYPQCLGVKRLKDKLAASEAKIKELKEDAEWSGQKMHDMDKMIAEKDKEIAALKRVNKTLNDSLSSNSRNFWKAEAIRLKKENEHMKKDLQEVCEVAYMDGFKPFFDKKINEAVQQALSELRDKLKGNHNSCDLDEGDCDYCAALLWVIESIDKAIDSRRTA